MLGMAAVPAVSASELLMPFCGQETSEPLTLYFLSNKGERVLGFHTLLSMWTVEVLVPGDWLRLRQRAPMHLSSFPASGNFTTIEVWSRGERLGKGRLNLNSPGNYISVGDTVELFCVSVEANVSELRPGLWEELTTPSR
jgi:hypothetical protein